MSPRADRRSADVLQAVDGLLRTHLEGFSAGARPLANLAAAMAIELSGASWGALLLDPGEGLGVALRLGGGEEEEPGLPGDDLVRQAAASRRTAIGGRRIATPIVESGVLRGVLYLALGDEGSRAEVAELAGAVATRIGALLQSSHLVEELARRTRNVTLLEGLGACLAAGTLSDEHLDRALEGAVQATGSSSGLLVLADERGDPFKVRARGDRDSRLRSLAPDLVQRMRRGEAPDAEVVNGHFLYEPLRIELVPGLPEGGTPKRPVGFLLVAGPAAPYAAADRSFFNAVVHLMNGALARLDFFRRAAEDPLTETGSRLALRLKLSEAQATALKTGRPFSLVLVDVDRFKAINDRHGHLVGDQVLRELAGLLRSRLRAEDSVARFGGDEFVIILPMTGAREAEMLAHELRELAAGSRFSEQSLSISLSMGVSTHHVAAPDVDEVLRSADRALYLSKSAGRDRITVAADSGPDRDG